MDVFTLYVGQGALAAVRSGNEAIIVDAHMPDTDDICQEQIERSLAAYVSKRIVRGLILTGFDADHACPAGVESILLNYRPEWVMYPTYFKDTETASEVFSIIRREEMRRARTASPLRSVSVRVDRVESRLLRGLATGMSFELFSPHMADMESSNNSSIVVKVTGLNPGGFRYLVTGDTETDRWEQISRFFGDSLRSDAMAASHHGSRNGVHPQTLLHVSPHTVLISAGVENSYGHPDGVAVRAYQKVARQVYCTSAPPDGSCLFTRRVGAELENAPSAAFRQGRSQRITLRRKVTSGTGKIEPTVASEGTRTTGPGIALCLSGGGFRATLFHLGAIRRLNEFGVLSSIDTISSVSGGSILNGVLATRWARLNVDVRGVVGNFKSEVVCECPYRKTPAQGARSRRGHG